MSRYVLPLSQVDRTQTTIAGGKGAHLGELSRIDGVRVPPGFCVTTDAYRTIVAGRDEVARRIDRLRASRADAPSTIRAVSQDIRRAIEASVIPTELAAMIEDALATLGSDATYAVRSSATAEDLPTASFAGQHDSYLNVQPAAVLEHVKRCWASLYSDRAVTYRLRNGVDDSIVSMAVVVQRMLFPESAGVIFTADPVTGNRKVAAVEAVVGLGEALVSGVTNADVFRVSDGRIVAREIGMKQLVMRPALEGGVRRDPIDEARQRLPALTDPQVVRLVGLGRAIEAHFGGPQDIEWCMANEEFQIVQSRPITTLFPVPQVDDDENHVYISVGHQQMMTDAMKPLGISVWQLTAARPMFTAGGRLFVDVAKDLASPASRARLLAMSSRSDPLVGDALRTIVERGTFIPTLEEAEAPRSPAAPPPPLEADPSIVDALIARNQSSIAALKHVIANETGPELLDLILADIQELRSILFDRESFRAIMAGMEATWWLDDQLQAWLGEKRAADTLSLAAPNNVTSEMGLALLDVADVIRPRREVIAFLERVRDDDTFLETLPAVPGGIEASDAIRAWLDRYGMRGVGEIDITRPRWIERPSTLVPLLLANVENFEPGAARRLVEHGQREAQRKREELLARLRALPDGEQKAEETTRTIDRLRTFIGYASTRSMERSVESSSTNERCSRKRSVSSTPACCGSATTCSF